MAQNKALADVLNKADEHRKSQNQRWIKEGKTSARISGADGPDSVRAIWLDAGRVIGIREGRLSFFIDHNAIHALSDWLKERASKC